MDLLDIKARDILVSNVITAKDDERIVDVENRMFKQGIGGLPVIDSSGNDKVIGMLTHRDIMIARHTLSLGGMIVRDLMSHNVITVLEDASILEILRILKKHDIERLPVVDGKGGLRGMIMHKNLLLKILEVLEQKHDIVKT